MMMIMMTTFLRFQRFFLGVFVPVVVVFAVVVVAMVDDDDVG